VGSVAPRVIGRYMLCGDIAAGGMATVHYGMLTGPAGFSRTVAIKRLHAQFARDADFVTMFMDEARLAARIRHPNVVQTLDIVALEGELFLVMDYVQGEALSRLLRASGTKGQPIPLEIVSSIVCGVLHGLHAAHEATADTGEPLGIVHRDVSPQNVLVGSDGIARLLDFGVAKAAGRAANTREGQVKGKFAYMAPEQVASGHVDRRSDVYAAGVVLWEMLTLKRLFSAENDAHLLHQVMRTAAPAPGTQAEGIPRKLDEIVLRALAKEPGERFDDARQMAIAIEAVVAVASPMRVATWIDGLAGAVLKERARSVALIESASSSGPHKALGDLLRESLTPSGAPVLPPELHPHLSSEPKEGLALSQASSSAPKEAPASTRGSRGLRLGFLVLVAAGGIALAGTVALSTFHADAEAGRPAPRETTAPAAQPSSPPPQEISSAAARRDTPEAAAPTAGTAVATAAVASPPAAPVKPPSAPRPVTRRAPDPGGDHCTIKSFVDESGIEHFVKECN
jgi:eukaryotic-like serine/threonine-protein kinase